MTPEAPRRYMRKLCLFILLAFGAVTAFFNFNELIDQTISDSVFTTGWYLRTVMLMLIAVVAAILLIIEGI